MSESPGKGAGTSYFGSERQLKKYNNPVRSSNLNKKHEKSTSCGRLLPSDSSYMWIGSNLFLQQVSVQYYDNSTENTLQFQIIYQTKNNSWVNYKHIGLKINLAELS